MYTCSTAKANGVKDMSLLRRMTDAAKRYAAANRSDPFAFDRAMTHINLGVVGFLSNGEDAFYDAQETRETRMLPNGTEYVVPAWKNIRRP